MEELAVDQDSTWIAFGDAMITDMADNAVVAIEKSGAQRVVTFVADEVRPILVQFDMSMDGEGTLTMTFDETMDTSSLSVNNLVIQNGATATVEYKLTVGVFSSLRVDDSTVIVLTLSKVDRNGLKTKGLAVSKETTWLRFDVNPFINDMNGKGVVLRADQSAMEATNYVGDTTNPALDSFDLNMASLKLAMTFSEPINTGSFHVKQIRVTDSATAGHFLLTSTVTFPAPREALITLSVADANAIKYNVNPALAKTTASTFVEFTADLVKDQSGNSIDATSSYYLTCCNGVIIKATGLNDGDNNCGDGSDETVPAFNGCDNAVVASGSPQSVDIFGADNLEPIMTGYAMDMQTGIIQVTFDEVVLIVSNLPTIALAGVVSTSEAASAEVDYSFAVESSMWSADGLSIEMAISTDDLNEVKRLGLCPTAAACVLTTPTSWITDSSAVPFPSNGRSPSSFQEDDISPTITEVSEYQADTRQITLVFPETVDAKTFDAKSISLSSSVLVGDSDSVTVTLSGGDAVTLNGKVLQFNLDDADYNIISADDKLCTKRSNCFVHIAANGIQDMYGNSIETVVRSEALSPTKLEVDATSPILEEWSLNMETGELDLTFDEPIRPSTINARGLTIQDAATASLSYTLKAGSTTSSNGLSMTVVLSDADVLALKSSNPSFAKSETDSYILISSITIKDTTGNAVVAIADTAAHQVKTYVASSTLVNLVDFALNMNSGVLTLTFDGPVKSLINLNAIYIQSNAAGDAESVQLTGGIIANPTAADGELVHTVALNLADLRSLKLIPVHESVQIALDTTNTFISFDNTLTTDTASVPIAAIVSPNAKAATSVVKDVTPPSLDYWHLDMDAMEITIRFTDVVLANTFEPTAFTIANAQSSTSGYSLTEETNTESEDGYILVLKLCRFDANTLKADLDIATGATPGSTNSWLYFSASAFKDTNDFKVFSVVPDEAVAVTTFTEDKTEPIIESFELDMSEGKLTIFFDETVYLSSHLDIEQFTLQNADSTFIYPLTGLDAKNQPTTALGKVVITLTRTDMDKVKILEGLVDAESTTYLLSGAAGIKDMNLNLLQADPALAVAAHKFTPDTVEPTLSSFSLNMDTAVAVLTMTFSETMKAQSTIKPQLVLQSTAAGGATYTLNGGTVTSTNSHIVVLEITKTDLDNVKEIAALADSEETTFLSFVAGTILDMSQNPVAEVSSSNAKGANGYVRDITDPTLESFSLDMDTRVLSMLFSESVDASSLTLSALTFDNNLGASHTLSLGERSLSDRPTVTVTLNRIDFDIISSKRALLTGVDDTYLTLTVGGIQDMAQNNVELFAAHNSGFTPDSTSPELSSFELDLNYESKALLTLSFTETIDADTLDMSFIDIVDGNPVTFTVAPGSDVEWDNTYDNSVVKVTLLPVVVNALKAKKTIGTDTSNTILNLHGTVAIKDTAGNEVVAVVQNAAAVHPDLTAPFLVSFTLDMSTRRLAMKYSEAISCDDIVPSEFTLVSTGDVTTDCAAATPALYTLKAGTVCSHGPSTDVHIDLDIVDMNALKLDRNLATSRCNTFLAFTAAAVMDMNDQAVVEVTNTAPQQVALLGFKEDSVAPTITSFDLNMNSGVLSMTFDETMEADSLDVAKLKVQNANGDSHILADVHSVGITTDSTTISVQISLDDMNALKVGRVLAISAGSTDLVMGDTVAAIEDMNGNALLAATLNNCNIFTEDVTSPEIEYFSINMNTGMLYFGFSETVDVATVAATKFTIRDSVNTDGFTLTATTPDYTGAFAPTFF
jgi:hypothetical protein